MKRMYLVFLFCLLTMFILPGVIHAACGGGPGGFEDCSPACIGNDGECKKCSSGAVCSKTGGSGCSTAVAGVYCCLDGSGGGGGGCTPTGCPSSSPWLCRGKCWVNVADSADPYPYGNTNCRKCP